MTAQWAYDILDYERSRIKESVRWHLAHGSDAGFATLVDIGVKQEAERLEHLAEKADKEGRGDYADALRCIQDVLPEIAHELRTVGDAAILA